MNGAQKIAEILELYKKKTIDFDVYIVADAQVKTIRESDARISHADESEFFSRSEFAEIASALFNVFGFAKVFYDEISFIEYFIQKKIAPEGCIVYNLSRDGMCQGKKSLIPAFCDLYNIRYTGSDAFVISLLRNKAIYSDILSLHGVNVPITLPFYHKKTIPEDVMNLLANKEIIIKNISESASIGLYPKCKMLLTPHTYQDFCDVAANVNSTRVLVQEFIPGNECEVLVIQQHGTYFALDPVEISFPAGKDFMDYQMSNNYTYGFKLLTGPVCIKVRQSAVQAAMLLGIKDYARFDFRIQNGTPYLIDIAGTPYTTHHSSIAYLFNQYSLQYEDIYKTIVTCMLTNY